MKMELNITGIPLRRGYGGTGGTWMACHPEPWRRMVRFEEPSNYGIRQGRISKLWMSNTECCEFINYDRGWDIRPASTEAKAVLAAIIKKFN